MSCKIRKNCFLASCYRKVGCFVFISFAVPSLISALSGRNFWPFFSYPMFSHPPESLIAKFKVIGVAPTERRIPLISYKYLKPTEIHALDKKVISLLKKPGGRERVKKALLYFAKNYEDAEGVALEKVVLIWKSNEFIKVNIDER